MRMLAGGMVAAGLSIFALACQAGAVPRTAPPRILRVSPEGAAAREGRFPSLEAALARAAQWRQRGDGALVVELEPGVHRLDRPVRIGPELSGTAGRPFVIRGAPDGSSRLVGSRPLPPAQLPGDLRARLPEAARGKVRAYRLPEPLRGEPEIRQPKMLNDQGRRVTEIFDRSGALRPAQWPNSGYAAAASASAAGFTLREGPPRLSDPEPELWAEGFWRWDWLNETIPVAGVDPRTGRITLAKTPYEGIREGARVRLFHALGQLDEPGEWWRDRRRGLLLAWPREGAPDLEAGVAETLFAIEDARHVRIENLRIERTRRDLIVVRGGEDVVIRNSDLGWAASRAALFENVLGGGLEACAVHDIGATAVRLVAGDRANLLPGGLFLRDTRLGNFARLSLTQDGAAQIDGVGAEVVGNYFHDAIGFAVAFRGNDHLFARNEVARLGKGLSDYGPIYAGRDWTARGTVIRDNYVHDIEPLPGMEVKGVMLDDMASGFRIERNLFVDVQKPVFIGGGSDNTVSGNLFVASSPAISLDSRGQTWMADAVTNPQSEIRAAYAAVPVDSPPWRERFPGLANLLSDEPKVARNNTIVDNIYLNSRPLFTEEAGDPKRQTILLNTEITLPDLKTDGLGLEALARLLAARGIKPRMDLAEMRRETLPERPFEAAKR